jgi:VIT1/CCC1 family predicted Fe2+/Mn2+ transporter
MSRPGPLLRLRESLDPGERLGEILFGLIMVLSFTLGAGIELAGDREATRELLIAALGCNLAWGVIDAALLLMNRLSERGRVHRLVESIQKTASREEALAMVTRELDERIPAVVGAPLRAALDQEVLERLKETKIERTRIGVDDLRAGFAVFLLVFLTALPAVVPFLVLRDALFALRASNAVLIGLLFVSGWRWAGYTGASRWGTGLSMMLLGIGLVVVAIALGG